jgi:hypothetical protein
MEHSAGAADAVQSEESVSTATTREQDIQEAVERLALEKELTEAIVNLTMQQLRDAEAMGRLSSRDQARLEQKYSVDLARVTKALQKQKQLLTLHELETAQQQLMQTFKAQLHEINQQIRQLKNEAPLIEPEVSDPNEEVEAILFGSPGPTGQNIDADDKHTSVHDSDSVEHARGEATEPQIHNSSSSKWFSILMVVTIGVFLVSSASITMGLLSAPSSANTGTLLVPSDQLGVYADAACTQPVTAIDWGRLASGEHKTFAVYLRNIGNGSCVLELHAMNWNPAYLSDHLLVSWDYAGQVLAVDDILPVVLTLEVSPDLDNVGAFSYDLVITTFS